MKIIRDTEQLFGTPLVASIGLFDGVHQGHRYLIEQLKAVARSQNLPSALITFTIPPRSVLQPTNPLTLLNTPEEKLERLSQTGVDFCIMLDFTLAMSKLSAKQFMQQILQDTYHVKTLLIGYDHRFGHNRLEGFEDYQCFGEQLGMKLILAKAAYNEGVDVSSSLIREELQQGNVVRAASLLTDSYFIRGTVMKGFQIGRTIGFPTANLKLNHPNKAIPANGVYAVQVFINKHLFNGMMNIGTRPTLTNDTIQSLEVHILDFDQDIYDQTIQVTFIKQLRKEIKFESVAKLIEQLQQDRLAVEQLFQNGLHR